MSGKNPRNDCLQSLYKDADDGYNTKRTGAGAGECTDAVRNRRSKRERAVFRKVFMERRNAEYDTEEQTDVR